MKIRIIVALLLITIPGFAEDSKHLNLAKKFDSVSGSRDKAALAAAFVPELTRVDPKLAPYKKELIEFITKIMESKEYREGKAQIYMEIFSESELEKLIKATSKNY